MMNHIRAISTLHKNGNIHRKRVANHRLQSARYLLLFVVCCFLSVSVFTSPRLPHLLYDTFFSSHATLIKTMYDRARERSFSFCDSGDHNAICNPILALYAIVISYRLVNGLHIGTGGNVTTFHNIKRARNYNKLKPL